MPVKFPKREYCHFGQLFVLVKQNISVEIKRTLLYKDKNIQIRQQQQKKKKEKNYDNTIFIFYPLSDVKFVKNGKQLAFSLCKLRKI